MPPQRRKLVHLKITPATVLEVVFLVISDKVSFTGELQTEILELLQEPILKHLTVVDGKLVTKKRQDLGGAQTINYGGEFSLTYHFTWRERHQAMLLRESGYQPVTIYPYQLHVYIDEPHKSDTLHTYFATTS
ncbi:hypothetical protein [Absidia glauca]|uniref:Uncharacterized protein n=1 Tax=Absidia glauca TaxID=4829 RepID=A0A163V4S3_ABSGL|nr:hypothetical protein [Absidia glauca]